MIAFTTTLSQFSFSAPVQADPIAVEAFSSSSDKFPVLLDGQNSGTGWKGGWSREGGGDAKAGTISAGTIEASKNLVLSSNQGDVSYFRDLKVAQGAEGSSVWIGFQMQKVSGDRFQGLSLFEQKQEKLFIGTPNGGNTLRLGTKAITNASSANWQRLVLRIDYRAGGDKAFLFVEPSASSIPDYENAVATAQGNFGFDRIRLAVGSQNASSHVRFGPIAIGTSFVEVAAVLDGAGADEGRNGLNTAQAAKPMPVKSWRKTDRGVTIETADGTFQLEPFLDGVIHVRFGPETAINSPRKSFVVLRQPAKVKWQLKESPRSLVVETDLMQAAVDRVTGAVKFTDSEGRVLLQEPERGGRDNANSPNFKVRQTFQLSPEEAIYGLGQFRNGGMNWRGQNLELVQVNTQSAIPVLLSTHGYGVLWDNPSRTLFSDSQAGTTFASDFGDAIDYYVMAGPNFDAILKQYRQLTGPAPMLPRWALGYIQSRNRYNSQSQLLDVARQMRQEKIPMDGIFLDYFYWGKYGTGSHQFDEAAFPDPKEMISTLRQELHIHLMATIWPSFNPKTANYADMKAKGYLLEPGRALDGVIYDPFNPEAGKEYWRLLSEKMSPLGIDSWFMDGPEPDQVNPFLQTTTAAGPAQTVRNLYPLMHTTNVYQGLRRDQPNQRVFILTRAAFAGQQRNATAVWSGDIGTEFAELKKQIPAGLNFCMAGMPFWTTDIGGYSGGDPADPAYRELFARWWQFGTFCPLFRSHGRRVPTATNQGPNELWAYGEQVKQIGIAYSNLRYRLMPYIYSLAANVTRGDGTIMRALPFDFANDAKVRDITDQFMFGPALLVNPITEAGATSRKLYLPAGANWIDFWTGKTFAGGQQITAAAPLETMPLYVRAGSILPMGPLQQYTDEKPADPIELRVYRGANATFNLYEDDGTTYNYEKGAFTTIPIQWNEKNQTLTIGKREGQFPGMLNSRTFNIVWGGVGNTISQAGQSVSYSGQALVIHPETSIR